MNANGRSVLLALLVLVAVGLAGAGCGPDPAPADAADSATTTDASSVDVSLVDTQTPDGADSARLDVPSDTAVAVDTFTPTDTGSRVDDGAARRIACITPNGSSVTNGSFGRLDGYLVAIVMPGARGCNGDPDHLHLQIQAMGGTYDVAVTLTSTVNPTNPEVYVAATDHVMPDGPWAEGWHPTPGNDYATTFAVHSNSFAAMSTAALAQYVETALATVNHISVFATGYGPTGVHKVHRNLGGDGAIVTQPLSPVPHVLMFRFYNNTF